MRPLLYKLAIAVLVVGTSFKADAFTLLGPAADWQTTTLGYQISAPAVGLGSGAGVGGPMNLGEDYRWNVPTVYYGFSPQFQLYFGERGMQEVEKAIAILNALPSADSLSLTNYPLSAERINYQAQALFLADIKSLVLSFMVEAMGITDPTRFVFTVRNRWIIGSAPTNYFVIMRNFDPVTWEPSAFINGQLWTYTSIIDNQTVPETLTVNETVDPLALQGLINAPVSSGIPTGKLLFGGFWTGLTRDDVGGLKYIYRHNNYNVESPPTNAIVAGAGAVSVGGTSSPWSIPVINTNGTGTTTTTGASNNLATITALRPGVGAVRFVRVDPSSQIGPFGSNSVSWVDHYVTNGTEVTENLIRPLVVPDIVFDAGDLQQNDAFANGYQSFFNGQLAWLTNGLTALGPGHYGPGVIPTATLAQASFVFTLNSVGPTYASVYPNNVSQITSFQEYRWASYDGTTNAPFIYPQGSTIQDVQNQVIGSGSGGINGGGNVSLVGVWTPVDQILFPPGTTTGGGTTGTGATTGAGTGATGP
jgi:hypothetical protein